MSEIDSDVHLAQQTVNEKTAAELAESATSPDAPFLLSPALENNSHTQGMLLRAKAMAKRADNAMLSIRFAEIKSKLTRL